MSHSTTIIGEITQRAKQRWNMLDDGVPDYDKAYWKHHWLKCAHEWKQELEKEGLTKSAEAVTKAIEFMEK